MPYIYISDETKRFHGFIAWEDGIPHASMNATLIRIPAGTLLIRVSQSKAMPVYGTWILREQTFAEDDVLYLEPTMTENRLTGLEYVVRKLDPNLKRQADKYRLEEGQSVRLPQPKRSIPQIVMGFILAFLVAATIITGIRAMRLNVEANAGVPNWAALAAGIVLLMISLLLVLNGFRKKERG